MWDSNALLQLLKTMPNKLSKENLEKIQLVIDADKYKNSLLSGFDLCDMYMYAPFCRGCKKTSIYPCAIAYVNMMKANGVDVEIDAKPVVGANAVFSPENVVEEQQINSEDASDIEQTDLQEQTVEEISVNPVDEVAATEEKAEEVITEPAVEVYENSAVEAEKAQAACVAPSETAAKRKIRIAVARKKI